VAWFLLKLEMYRSCDYNVGAMNNDGVYYKIKNIIITGRHL
jgi:hypothetical protein